MNKHRKNTYIQLDRLGIGEEDATALIRASMALHRWAERECNGEIQRDEETGKPYVYSAYDGRKLYATADREKGALDRAKKIATKYGLGLYHQTDPRGCALYLIRPGDVPAGADVDAYYSRGVAVVA